VSAAPNPSGADQARRFFDVLPLEAPGELVIYTLPDRRPQWFESIPRAIEYALQAARDRDVYFTTSTHDRSRDPETKRGSIKSAAALLAVFADIDVAEGKHAATNYPSREKALGVIAGLALPPSAIVSTGGGYHVYWPLKEPFRIDTPADRETAERILKSWQHALRVKLGRLDDTADLARILRVPGTFNRKNGIAVPVELQTLTEARYNLDDFEPFLPTPIVVTPKRKLVNMAEQIPRGGHRNGLRDRAAKLAWVGIKPPTIVATLRALIDGGILEGGENPADPFTDENLAELAESAQKFSKTSTEPAAGEISLEEEERAAIQEEGAGADPDWPAPPKPEAFHGLAGDIVRTIAPHTEADDVAILGQFLVMFGNAVGGSPHVQVGADLHGTNLFIVLVGQTSRGRKGTSEGQARRILAGADASWAKERIVRGLSSGEGLIQEVRDPVLGEDGKLLLDDRGRPVDAGVPDRRLLVVESEFGSTLRVMRRDSNILSGVIRQAWDSGTLRTLTKRSPIRASGAHISIIGHVTKTELLKYMDGETDNGFANRFLWLRVRRSKLLPDGGTLTDAVISDLSRRVEAALDAARRITEVRRDQAAADLWRSVYPTLSSEHPGLFGAVTSRAEAQVIRLSLLYALLDGSATIREPHLKAALALWDYAAASARHIFGDLLGDPIADRLLRELRAVKPAGLSRTQITGEIFGKNYAARDVERALRDLESLQLAISRREPSRPGSKGGRPVEWWMAR
jgi:hypothetical protein